MVRMGLAERLELLGRAAVLQAAAGVHVGQDHDLVGRQDLRRLGHEADAAEGDDVGVGRLRLAAEIEAVADEIGNVLDFGRLVIMGEDDGVALLAQPVDLGAQVEALQARHWVRSWVPCPYPVLDPERPIEKAGRLAPVRADEPRRHARLYPGGAQRQSETPGDVAQCRVRAPRSSAAAPAPGGSAPPARRGGSPRR